MANTRFKLIFGDEKIIPASGLGVVGAMLVKSDFKKHCDRQTVNPKRSQPQIKKGDILLTYIGLLAQGKTAYEAVNEFNDDPDFYQSALGIAREIPSAETLRQRMDGMGNNLRTDLLEANVEMFTSHDIKPTALSGGLVPLDMDVTPFDNSKTM